LDLQIEVSLRDCEVSVYFVSMGPTESRCLSLPVDCSKPPRGLLRVRFSKTITFQRKISSIPLSYINVDKLRVVSYSLAKKLKVQSQSVEVRVVGIEMPLESRPHNLSALFRKRHCKNRFPTTGT
jgi:hypothetical protein